LSQAWAGVIWIVLPDTPANARWLNAREKYIAVERMRESQGGLKTTKFKLRQGLSAFLDPKLWLLWGMALRVFLILLTRV
jgi:ACS family allantoate permease-like MFS transporter